MTTANITLFVYLIITFFYFINKLINVSPHKIKVNNNSKISDVYRPVAYYQLLLILSSVIWPIAILIDYYIWYKIELRQKYYQFDHRASE